ncbi:MAG: hypothetical protein ACE5HC_13660 [Candidatus Binatia bacterium]
MVILEVIIGLVFVYLILSLICSAVQETIAAVCGWRSNTLQEGIQNLLDDPNIKDAAGNVRDLKEEVYNHPLVNKLAKKGKRPSYVPARNFAVALLDVLKDPNASGGPLTEARATVDNLPHGPVRKALAGLIDTAQGDIAQVRKNIETWFDDSMDRVSGWYKRNAHKWMVGIALGLTIFMNVDSVEISRRLWKDPQLRAQVVAQADVLVDKNATELEKETIKNLQQELNELPVGWDIPSLKSLGANPWSLIPKVVGLILTTIAVSLGAPFWFDGLNKLLNIRAAGRRPEKAAP